MLSNASPTKFPSMLGLETSLARSNIEEGQTWDMVIKPIKISTNNDMIQKELLHKPLNNMNN